MQPKFFIYPVGAKFGRTIFTEDLASPRAATKIELPEELGVDFVGARMLQIKSYALLFEPVKPEKVVKVYRLDKITSAKPQVTRLPDLPRYASDFSVANFHDEKVILSGG